MGGTTSFNTGPPVDHTTGTTAGVYLYLETSGCSNNTANLISPVFDFTSVASPFITIWYHMQGATMGTMHADISTDGGATFTNDFFEPGWTDNQNLWQPRGLDAAALAGQSNVVLRIRGESGTSFTSDMAIDDITVSDGMPVLPPSLNSSNLAGCLLSIDFNNGPADIEICGMGLPSGDPGCTTLTGQTSVATIDLCALGIEGLTTITLSNGGGSASLSLCVPVAASCPSNILLVEDFETGLGGFTQTGTNDWLLDMDEPGSGNGPDAPTCGNQYVYWETSGTAETPAELNFPTPYDLTFATAAAVDFLFHGVGSSTTSANEIQLQASIDGFATTDILWSHNTVTDGNIPALQSDPFVPVSIDLSVYSGSIVELQFVGVLDDWFSDIAIDFVVVQATNGPSFLAVTQTGGACGGGGVPTIDIQATIDACTSLEYSIDGGATWSTQSNYSDPAFDGQCFDVVIRDANDPTNTVAYPDMVCFSDIIAPEAVCADDVEITLVNGVATITVADIDGGSTDNCGIDFDASSVSPSSIDCSNVGFLDVTLTIVDLVGGLTDECVATISVFADGACGADLGNEGGPTITDPCTCGLAPGTFNEEVFLQSTSAGQMWTITAVSGLTDLAGTDYAVGDLMTDNGDGTYSLLGIHLDGVGYSVTVASQFFPGVSLQAGNTCFYPAAEIENDLSILCLNSPLMTLAGNAAGAAGVGSFTVNGAPATELDPMALGVGAHSVEFCFDAGTATGTNVVNGVAQNSLADAQADPGCETCVTQGFTISETPSSFACNDRIQISANEDCETDITPDMIMEGGTGSFCYDDYTVSLGGSVPNPITPTYFGRDIIVTVTHLVSGNQCWGTIVLEDKDGPELDCTVDLTDKMGNVIQSGAVINIDCETDPATIPGPEAMDNCDRFPLVSLQSEVETGDKCGGITLTRTYTATDRWNNEAAVACVITINIAQPTQVRFPDDVTWTCQQYEAYNSITDASALHPLIIANAASMDLSDYCCIAGNDGDDVAGVAPYQAGVAYWIGLLYTSPGPRDAKLSRMPSSA